MEMEVSDFVIDFIALVRTLTVTPKTFENFIWKAIKMLPVGCTTLHVVADSYREVSIKSAEKKKRGFTPQVYVKSVFSNVPREFQEFLKNSDNKDRLIELFFDYVIQKRCNVLNDKRCEVLNDKRASKILLPKDGLCMHVTPKAAVQGCS